MHACFEGQCYEIVNPEDKLQSHTAVFQFGVSFVLEFWFRVGVAFCLNIIQCIPQFQGHSQFEVSEAAGAITVKPVPAG